MALHTTSGALTLVADGILISVGTGFTGTITTTVAGSTQYGSPSATIGVITNPVVGNTFRYGGLRNQGVISVTPSTTCDITVTALSQANV